MLLLFELVEGPLQGRYLITCIVQFLLLPFQVGGRRCGLLLQERQSIVHQSADDLIDIISGRCGSTGRCITAAAAAVATTCVTSSSATIAQNTEYLAERLADALRGLADAAVGILPNAALGRHITFQGRKLLLQIQ